MWNSSFAALLALALVADGCASRRAWKELEHWENELELSAKVPSSIESGKATVITFEIRNVGRRTIKSCMGPGRMAVAFVVNPVPRRPRNSGSGTSVDHPGCVRNLALEPGTSFDWSEEVSFGKSEPGAARLLLEVEIVHPGLCDRDGCSSRKLAAWVDTEIR
jgi:hypothetical protein